jgi:hypothetical protein
MSTPVITRSKASTLLILLLVIFIIGSIGFAVGFAVFGGPPSEEVLRAAGEDYRRQISILEAQVRGLQQSHSTHAGELHAKAMQIWEVRVLLVTMRSEYQHRLTEQVVAGNTADVEVTISAVLRLSALIEELDELIR